MLERLPLPRATFVQLRTFAAVARLGSVTRAAAHLHLAQPTVSTQLKQLAEGVGATLFVPSGRGIRLTAAGAELEAAVRDVFARWADFVDARDSAGGVVRGVLRVAGVTTSEYFVAQLLRDFIGEHAGVEIDLAVDNRAAVAARIERGDDDCAIMMMPPDDGRLGRMPFLRNPLVAVVALDHPCAEPVSRRGMKSARDLAKPRRRIPLGRFAAEPMLVREVGSGTRRVMEAHLAQHGLAVEPRMTLGSNEAIKHAVAAGLGVAVVSGHALSGDGRREGLAVAAVATLPIERWWQIVWRLDRPLPPPARAFLAFVRARAVPGAPLPAAIP